ncbi:SusC/RagA family TonB-linked outer membrane protein [Labilibacter marinus]|uniref:SusC/RagA family TonB-linked outer membrane protein n=1 Tax=Labilibacter marinus TaxID=1477105 RepID=UPI00094F7DDE|nr:TonB-dependent receptor [Labilibacter marinus]
MKKKQDLHVLRAFPLLEKMVQNRISRMAQLTMFCLCALIIETTAAEPNAAELISSEVTNQEKTITGVVKDKTGEALPGVAVVIKGTTQGTITDIDGNFTLPGVAVGAIIEVSFVGMKTQEFVVSEQSNINVVLEDDAIGLEEVVAIGYTTRKKGEVTGSISTIKSEEIANTSSNDIAKSLTGKVPGLIVSDRGGYPGESGNTSILIRGKSTLGNNSPLILIDGITAASFSHLAPQDIESLTVLKDGAAAIYGARAANGVILITTKRGKQGKPTINFSSTYNMSSFSAMPDQMTSEQYAIYENEIAERNGTSMPYSQEDIAKYASGEDPINYPNTNWSDLTFADYSPELRSSLSISGGSEKVNYFVSGDYIDQTGMYESGDLNFKQYQVRSNLDIKVWENFKIGVDLTGRFGERNQPGVNASYIYKHIYTNSPTDVGVYPNGLPGWGGENGANPAVMSSAASGNVNQHDNDLRSKFSFNWDMNKWVKGLSAKGFVGIRKQSNDIKSWYTPWTVYQYQQGSEEYVPVNGFSQRGNERILRESFWKYDETMLNATVHYNNTFNDTHTVRAFGGFEQMTSTSRTFWAERRGFPSPDHSDLFAGSDEGQQSSGVSNEWARLNFFGSVAYDYKKKYFIDLTLRHDGSSNFADGKRFGTFPGVAVSWSLADEGFMDFTDSWLNTFKIRSSWAVMGNDRIAAFQHLTRYDYGGPYNNQGVKQWTQPNSYIFGTTGTMLNGYRSNNVPNPDVTWETADTKNIGINFTVLDRRLTADANYFYQKRKDILIQRSASIPDAAGLQLPDENLGEVDNFGWEFQLDWSDKVGEVGYNLGATFTNAKNKVVYMDEAADVPEAMKREGHPLDSYVVYPTFGIFRDQEQVENTTAKLEGTVEGEPHYMDVNGDGMIDANDRIRKYTSNVPEIQYGFYGGVQYKGWDLNFLFQGQAKAEMLVFFDQAGAKPEHVFTERWTTENRGARYPRAFAQGDKYSSNQSGNSDNFQGADFWLHDASYLRLKQLDLGYTFNKEQIKIGDLKVFVRGFNLLTLFSDVHKLGLDPEAAGYDNFRGSTYPSLKTYTLGVNFTF